MNNQKHTSVEKEETISINDYTFNPSDLVIEKGTKIIWINEDAVSHTIVGDEEVNRFESELLEKGDSFSFVFETVGQYKYHCGIHPSMKAMITVEE